MRVCFYLLGVLFLAATAAAQDDGGGYDHAGMIADLDDQALARGQAIFQSSCASCHGLDGNTTALPTARAFGRDAFRFGSDPYSLWRTISYGGGMMLPQTWLNAEERYAVIHYLREVLIKPANPDQYTEVTRDYLDGLPKGKRRGTLQMRGWPRDYGPALASQIRREINHALTIRLDPDTNLSYDLHRFMVVEAWRGHLDLRDTQHLRLRGEGQPEVAGPALPAGATWYWVLDDGDDAPAQSRGPRGIDGSHPTFLTDPSRMDYHGHYLYGDRAILSAAVRGRDVRDMPGVTESDDLPVFHHTLRVAPGEQALRLCVGEFSGDGWPIEGVFPLFGAAEALRSGSASGTFALSGAEADSGAQGPFVAAGAVGETSSLVWTVSKEGKIFLEIPPSENALHFRVYQAAGENSGSLERFTQLLDTDAQRGLLAVPDLAFADSGGPRRWRESPLTQGELDDARTHYDPIDYEKEAKNRGNASAAHVPYTVDTIALPEQNRWNAWMRPSCLAFFPDGRLALGTYGGDVWIVSGIDDDLDRIQWQRHAAGLFEAMGMKVVDGDVYVTTRTGVIRLQDFNGDGEADFYEQFFADPEISNGFHAYNFGLVRDADGYFYYVKPGLYTDYTKAGALLKITPDGTSYEEIAHGFRVPNGLGISPNDTLFVSDNQGQWTPANEINRIEPGGFYGVFQGERRERTDYNKPMLYLPQEFDNSPGSVVYANDTRFGPLSGMPTHTSFGKGWMYYLLFDDTKEPTQAAAIALPFQFDAGTMRSAVNPADGQLYVTGLTGWDTESITREGCLHRVRYTGGEGCMLTGIEAHAGGFRLTFSSALDENIAANPDNYQIDQWNYRWAAEYGSDHWSVRNPRDEGQDEIDVQATTLSADGTTVHLKTGSLQPAEQIRVRFDLQSADGAPVSDTAYLTINKLAK